jgi:hypothetical protein
MILSRHSEYVAIQFFVCLMGASCSYYIVVVTNDNTAEELFQDKIEVPGKNAKIEDLITTISSYPLLQKCKVSDVKVFIKNKHNQEVALELSHGLYNYERTRFQGMLIIKIPRQGEEHCTDISF